ncbi:MAG: pseudaminic acid synthase [Candidatus Omnitrophica bacterium CG07_land_8_20_14_0_80_42_15]|uniref:Pseudaminic acid synthase n=1 Tax=Candidatus Aquitaenariimonas noxiae TaxID=1974741 RepID=A0A2J0KTK8_9BACT|nr:MAG: pseudaminic acid synthase [Candidatus Omnitrophica bacterium CG07_land_8_20_14_0_80_42_15]
MKEAMDLDIKFLKNCFIVTEISANHCRNFKQAIALIKKAKECGADAVKFQTYTPDTLTIDVDNKYFRIKHPKWKGQTLYQLYRKAYTPWLWFKKLKRIADSLGIIFYSTAFDKTSVDFLEELNVPIHKISSFELVDLPLIEYVARTKKPLMLSTGMATLSEVKEAVNAAEKAGAKDIILLRCVSNYPAKPEEMNLKTILHMQKLFKCPIGLSDHTLGIAVSLAAVSLGAKVIEKHFILSRNIKTPDSFFSIEPQELLELVRNIRIVEKSLGRVHYGSTEGETKNKVFRRSLFIVKDIKKGEKFTEENIRSIRPAYGIHPKYFKHVIGKKAKRDIKKGAPLKLELVS